MPAQVIKIIGARQHNLKNLSVEIPREKLVVITGLSGSGKSSLAFDTLYAEGQRRYVESLSAYARQFLGQMDKPKYDSIKGLSPTIAIEQKSASSNPRSTVGTITEIYDYLRVLYARAGDEHDRIFSEKRACPNCGIGFPELAPPSFSFNSPLGMCVDCTGLGTRLEMDPDLIVPSQRLSIRDGAIEPWATAVAKREGWV